MKRIDAGILAAAAAAFGLAACHDGSFVPDEDPNATAEGVYSGALTDSPSGATDFTAIILADGTFWTLYGAATPTSFTAEGFARGNGTSDDGEFTAAGGTDYGFTPPEATTLEALYDAGDGTIEGTYVTTAGTTSFSGGALANSSYDYDTAADLLLLAGAWDLAGTDGITYTLDIAVDGTVDFTEQGGGGCTGSGTFVAHSSGKSLFTVSLTFDNVMECALPDGTAIGIALAYPITGADATQLIVAVNDDDAFGLALSGTLPTP